MKRIRLWLIDHSALYRRYHMWRFKRSMAKMQKSFGKALLPTVNQVIESLKDWNKT